MHRMFKYSLFCFSALDSGFRTLASGAVKSQRFQLFTSKRALYSDPNHILSGRNNIRKFSMSAAASAKKQNAAIVNPSGPVKKVVCFSL